MVKKTVKFSWLVALFSVCLLAVGCGNKATDQGKTEEKSVSTKPELGTWGVDLTAQKKDVKPGDDFFAYANGTWLDTFQIPEDRDNYGSFNVLADLSRDRIKIIIDELKEGTYEKGSIEQKISDFFNSYMDVEKINSLGIEPLKPLLADIDAAKNLDDITLLFGKAPKDDLTSPIVVFPGINRKNPDLYQFNLAVGGMGLPDRDYYLQDTDRFKSIREAYVKHIAEMLAFAGVKDTDKKAQDILNIETKIAEKQWSRSERRNRDKTLNQMSYDEFKNQYKGFDWDAFLAARDMSALDNLNVLYPDTLKAVISIINEEPVENWKTYLTYKAISNHANLLSEEIDSANFNFYGKTLRGTPKQRPRWERGVGIVSGRGSLGDALGQIYVQRYFPASSKVQMEELVANLRKALGDRIDHLDWMGEETKLAAHKKLDSFNPKIAYPNKWKDYSSLVVEQGDLFGNAKRLDAFNLQDQVSRLAKKTDKDEWHMTPQTVNAYYNPEFNEVVFPAAILQPPFFDPNADPAVNYGGIGAVIGHEMGHGFDDQGSKSDEKGIQRNWWTDEDRAAFDKRAQELVEQYNGFEALPDSFVDGKFTLGENIGDVGGMNMAYHAYKLSLGGKEAPVIDGLTGDQRFFLAWAQVWQRKYRDDALLSRLKSDPHSPAQFRVNGVVRNMDVWYKAFDVKEGDALYLAPEKRVSIW